MRPPLQADEKRNSEEVKELCCQWMLLSEAYRQSGNFQSAVRAVESVLHCCPSNVSAKLQLLRLYQGMCQYKQAIELGEALLSSHALTPGSALGTS